VLHRPVETARDFGNFNQDPSYNACDSWGPQMLFLTFMDGVRADLAWITWAVLLGLAVYLIRAPKMVRSWRKTAMRVVGAVLLVVFVCVSPVFAVGGFLGADPPREHIGFISPSSARDALLSHSSLRDGAATQVSVKERCCRRFIAYEYFGDGDDYMDGNAVQWIDNHHLAIRYALDSSGQQTCHPYVGDVMISCEPRPDPFPEP
jgi:hypothetical protein